MVKLGVNNEYQNDTSQEMISILLPSIGLVSLIVSLFFGIKLKWFRYRMTFPTSHEDNPELLRAHSVTEIRENCSVGVYRQSISDESSIRNDNEIRSTPLRPSSTLNSVKSKSSDRESIFRWPFRSKISLSRSASNAEENNSRISSIGTNVKQVERREKDPALSEKNERLRKSIYERLNSINSMSMPDLVQCEDYKTVDRESPKPSTFAIQKGVEVSLDESAQYHTIDEIQEMKVSVPVKIIPIKDSSEINILKELNEIVNNADEEEDIEIPPRPPTPIRRRSRSNSLRPLEQKEEINVDNAIKQEEFIHQKTEIQQEVLVEPEIQPEVTVESEIQLEVIVEPEIQPIPPPIKPRKKNINYAKTVVDHSDEAPNINEIIIVHEEESLNENTPKSILKTDHSHHVKTNVHFINVPDSDSEDEDSPQVYNDVWSKIDIHRQQLMKNIETNSPTNSPPPLPKTPPPTADIQDRDFQFA